MLNQNKEHHITRTETGTSHDHTPSPVANADSIRLEDCQIKANGALEESSETTSTRLDQKPELVASRRATTEERNATDLIHEFVSNTAPELAASRQRIGFISSLGGRASVLAFGAIISDISTGWGWPTVIFGASLGVVQLALPYLQAKLDLVKGQLVNKVSTAVDQEFASQVHSLGYAALADGKCHEVIEEVRSNQHCLVELMSSMHARAEHLVSVAASLAVIGYVSPFSSAVLVLAALPMFSLRKRHASFVKEVEESLSPLYEELYPFRHNTTDHEIATELKIAGKAQWCRETLRELGDKILCGKDSILQASHKVAFREACFNAVSGVGVSAYSIYATMQGYMDVGSLAIILGGVTGLQLGLSNMSKEYGSIVKNALFTKMLFGLNKIKPTGAPEERTFEPDEVVAMTKKLQQHRISILLENIKVTVADSSGGLKTILSVDQMAIPWGKMIGVVGLKGAGKSTLMSVLLGTRRPSEGRVVLCLHKDTGEPDEQIPLADIPLSAWHNQIGYAPQTAYNGYGITVAKSISLGTNEFDPDPLGHGRAMEMTGVSDFVSPDQVSRVRFSWSSDKDSGLDNRRFSPGEVRAIVNTRAIIGNRVHLFLDEPTAGQDSLSEGRITENLKSYRGSKTQIIISHSFGTLKHTDLVIEVEDGVARIGTHGALLSNSNGIYSRLRAAQEKGLELSPEQLSSN